MPDLSFLLLVLLFAACVWTAWGVVAALRARRRLAGVRLVTCPETGTLAAVGFDRTHAALTAFVQDQADAQLERCSRWPARGRCDQPCLLDALDPERRTSSLVARWAADKRCVYCGKPLVEAPVVGHHVAVLGASGGTIEWCDVAPETLPQALASGAPVCWDCHVVETFRRVHPELVTDRELHLRAGNRASCPVESR